MADQHAHRLRPLWNALRNIVARAVVELVDDGRKLQMLQLSVNDKADVPDGEHFQPYGFSSVPLPGAEAVVAFPSGDRAHPLVVAVSDRRYRPTGHQGGEVTLYNFTGAKVTFTKDGDIIAEPAPGRYVLLGSAAAADPPALLSQLTALKAAIDGWTPVAGDGGAALKAALTALFTGPPAWPAGATKVKAE